MRSYSIVVTSPTCMGSSNKRNRKRFRKNKNKYRNKLFTQGRGKKQAHI